MSDWPKYLIVAVWLACAAGTAFLFEKVIIEWLRKSATKTRWQGDNIILNAIKGVAATWAMLAGFYMALRTLNTEPGILHVYRLVMITAAVLSCAIIAARVAVGLIKRNVGHAGRSPSTSIVVNIVRIAIAIVCVLIVLQIFGIPVTPMLTALGVGALAVALALQDTLTNLFSGIQVIASRQVRIGDYIKLDSGDEGYVTDITWRNTIVRALSNNYIIIPNSKIASAIVTNYYLPEKELSVLVELGVSYDSDLDKVEEVTVATGKEVMLHVTGGVPNTDPFIRYHTFGDSSIKFSVILRGKEFTDQYLIKHEFLKLVIQRYREYGITIPFPTRTLYMLNQEKE